MTSVDRGRGRRQFLLLAFIFLAPLLAAYLLFYHFPEYIPDERTNYGQLVDPARPVPTLPLLTTAGEDAGPGALRGKWTYVYIGTAACSAACEEKLVQIRQIRAGLNEKRLRVRRVYLAPSLQEARELEQDWQVEHPDLEVLADPQGAARRFFTPEDPQALYLLDPLGNWMMTYPGAAQWRGMVKDIKRLLRISQIG